MYTKARRKARTKIITARESWSRARTFNVPWPGLCEALETFLWHPIILHLEPLLAADKKKVEREMSDWRNDRKISKFARKTAYFNYNTEGGSMVLRYIYRGYPMHTNRKIMRCAFTLFKYDRRLLDAIIERTPFALTIGSDVAQYLKHGAEKYMQLFIDLQQGINYNSGLLGEYMPLNRPDLIAKLGRKFKHIGQRPYGVLDKYICRCRLSQIKPNLEVIRVWSQFGFLHNFMIQYERLQHLCGFSKEYSHSALTAILTQKSVVSKWELMDFNTLIAMYKKPLYRNRKELYLDAQTLIEIFHAKMDSLSIFGKRTQLKKWLVTVADIPDLKESMLAPYLPLRFDPLEIRAITSRCMDEGPVFVENYRFIMENLDQDYFFKKLKTYPDLSIDFIRRSQNPDIAEIFEEFCPILAGPILIDD